MIAHCQRQAPGRLVRLLVGIPRWVGKGAHPSRPGTRGRQRLQVCSGGSAHNLAVVSWATCGASSLRVSSTQVGARSRCPPSPSPRASGQLPRNRPSPTRPRSPRSGAWGGSQGPGPLARCPQAAFKLSRLRLARYRDLAIVPPAPLPVRPGTVLTDKSTAPHWRCSPRSLFQVRSATQGEGQTSLQGPG